MLEVLQDRLSRVKEETFRMAGSESGQSRILVRDVYVYIHTKGHTYVHTHTHTHTHSCRSQNNTALETWQLRHKSTSC
jgi:chorismate-pyruvate lyase